MLLNNLTTERKDYFKEKVLSQLRLFLEEVPDKLKEIASYALFPPGKLLRPLLTLSIVEAHGKNPELAIFPACALEMLHTYSLIHDDLPCMDNDDFRRGRPSLHKAFNEQLAILTGDFLLTKSFEILSRAPNLSLKQKIDLITVLSKAGGGNGMIGGQIIDIEPPKKEFSLDDLLQLHSLKTGALISAACEFGAIIAKLPSKERLKLKELGTSFGITFQIKDDLDDNSKNEKSILNFMTKEEAKKKLNELSQKLKLIT